MPFLKKRMLWCSSQPCTAVDERVSFGFFSPASFLDEMDIETVERYGNKRTYHRSAPMQHIQGGPGKVCFHWRAGRCTRHPCPFLHAEPPVDAAAASKRKFAGDHQSLAWRNPKAGFATTDKWGKGRGGDAVGVRGPTRVCKYFLSGNCTFGDNCKFLHSLFVGDGFSLLTPLKGHEKVITGITLPSGSDKLYSGSKDEKVRVWDCQTGQCVAAIDLGGEIGCMLSEGPWIFIGILNAVKVWNTQTGTDLNLPGPTGQVYALAIGNEMLFAGTQDGHILAWKFSAVGNCFEPAASLSGHRLAVVSLVVGGFRLYSGSMDNTIQVWDITNLQCLLTLTDHTAVVMSVLCWDQFLISCSLDNSVKIWVTAENGSMEVTYTHKEEHGVLALCGMYDSRSKPVLFCSCNDNTMRLYDLPSFSERGKIFSKDEVRAIQIGPGGLFFTGDGAGELKVWKWLAEDTPSNTS